MKQYILLLTVCFSILFAYFWLASSRTKISVEPTAKPKVAVVAKDIRQKEPAQKQAKLEAERKAKEVQPKIQGEKEVEAKKEKAAKQTTELAMKTKTALPEAVEKEKKEEKKNTFYASAGYDTNYMHYRELAGNNTLNRSYGRTDGYYITVGCKHNNYIDKLLAKPFVEGYFRRFGDLANYDGRTTAGVDFKFKQRSTIRSFGVKLGVSRDFAKGRELSGYFDVGRRIWYSGENETINGVLTYTKKYDWTFFGFGARFAQQVTPRFFWGVEAEGLFAPNSLTKMRADLFEGATFNLGSVYGVDIKMPLRYYLFKDLSFDLNPYYTHWKINKSNTVTISGTMYQEPKSKTHISGLSAGFTRYF